MSTPSPSEAKRPSTSAPSEPHQTHFDKVDTQLDLVVAVTFL
jgi:hypothetical protein